MSPLSLLIDHSQLLNRVETLYSFAPAEETFVADEQTAAHASSAQGGERIAQIKGLVCATLPFAPFLFAYVVACASR